MLGVLARATEHLTAADVPSQPTTRIDLNLAAGILKARRELGATDVIMGWSDRTTTPEFFFGSLLENMLAEREYNLIVSRPRVPLDTCNRLLVAVPPDAQHEPGFLIAMGLVKRLARQLDGKMLLLTEARHEPAISQRVAAVRPSCELGAIKLEKWTGLVRAISENAASGDVLVVYGARPGGLAWRPAMGLLPGRLASIFPRMNLLLVYPAMPRDEHAETVVGPPAPTILDFGPVSSRLRVAQQQGERLAAWCRTPARCVAEIPRASWSSARRGQRIRERYRIALTGVRACNRQLQPIM